MADASEWDTLFLACTRPAMKIGVPLEGLYINGAVSYLSFLWIGHGNLWWMLGTLPIFPMIHFPMRLLTSLDHNIFHELFLWADTSGINLRVWEWQGAILRALPYGVPKQARDMTGSV